MASTSLSGVWFGTVCATLALAMLAVYAAWALDRRRDYLLLIAPTPAMTGLSLIVQAAPQVWLGWRLAVSGALVIAAALLCWSGLVRRSGYTLGRRVVVGTIAIGVAAFLVTTVVVRSPLWTLHCADAIVAVLCCVGTAKARLLADGRRSNTVLGIATLLFAVLFLIRSWLGLDPTVLARGHGPDLGGWSDWVLIAYAVLTVVIAGVITTQEVRDIVDRVQAERDCDPLTGLLNRRGFEAAVVARMRGGRSSCTLILSDLDRFKEINDKQGHRAGDEVLTRYGALVRDMVSGGVVGRIGGEEFAILLPDATVDEARGVAERLRVTLESTVFGTSPEQFHATVSSGMAVGEPGVPYDAIFLAADDSLYRAKSAGRNTTWPEVPALVRERDRPIVQFDAEKPRERRRTPTHVATRPPR